MQLGRGAQQRVAGLVALGPGAGEARVVGTALQRQERGALRVWGFRLLGF